MQICRHDAADVNELHFCSAAAVVILVQSSRLCLIYVAPLILSSFQSQWRLGVRSLAGGGKIYFWTINPSLQWQCGRLCCRTTGGGCV